MRSFNSHSGIAAALRRDNVDTDIIIPMAVLVSKPRDQLGDYAFQQIRYHPDGTEAETFVLNKPAYRAASILISGRNFGCGSSREWAVYAIQEFGIRTIIAPSYGDIFFANCIKNGILPVALSASIVSRLMDDADLIEGKKDFLVDLETQQVVTPDGYVAEFDFDAGYKNRLLSGRDEIAITLEHDDDIAACQRALRKAQPWLFELERNS